MKRIMDFVIKAMMFVVVAYCVKVAVWDLWDCYLAVDMVEAAHTWAATM